MGSFPKTYDELTIPSVPFGLVTGDGSAGTPSSYIDTIDFTENSF